MFEIDALARVRWESETRVRYLDELPSIEASAREYLAADPVALGAVKYAFVTAIEGCVREPVARAVGFRDVLVHEYTDVDDAAVRANVASLADLEAFVAAVAAWDSESALCR